MKKKMYRNYITKNNRLKSIIASSFHFILFLKQENTKFYI